MPPGNPAGLGGEPDYRPAAALEQARRPRRGRELFAQSVRRRGEPGVDVLRIRGVGFLPMPAPQYRNRIELLQGTLDLLILQVVSLGSLHGYAIAQRLNQISKSALEVNQGSLYPALYRLEKRGWLRSEWRIADSGRDAKFYSLTRAGSKRLEVERTEWSRISQAIALVLKAVS